MHTTPSPHTAFKRQVVFRIGPDDWPLLQAAATEHGSIQAAILAALHALTAPADTPPPAGKREEGAAQPDPARSPAEPPAAPLDLDRELRAREAAQLLGLKTSTIAGYIRTGKLPGHYDETPLRPNTQTCHGWTTTRRAIEEYRHRLQKPVTPPGNSGKGFRPAGRPPTGAEP